MSYSVFSLSSWLPSSVDAPSCIVQCLIRIMHQFISKAFHKYGTYLLDLFPSEQKKTDLIIKNQPEMCWHPSSPPLSPHPSHHLWHSPFVKKKLKT